MPMSADPNELRFRKRIRVLSALGPYLREPKCHPGSFYFDCLTCCIDADVDADKRQFYGWWLQLEVVDGIGEYHYQFGCYDAAGCWCSTAIPSQLRADVELSLHVFYDKLFPCLRDELALQLKPSAVLAKALVLSAA